MQLWSLSRRCKCRCRVAASSHKCSFPSRHMHLAYKSSTIYVLLHPYLTQSSVHELPPKMESLTPPPPPYTTHPTTTMAQPAATMPQTTLTSAQKIEMVQAELEVAKLRLRQQTRERQGLGRVAPSRASVLQRLTPRARLR